MALPPLIPWLAFAATAFFPLRSRPLSIILMGMAVVMMVKFMFDIRRVKLRIKDIKAVQPVLGGDA
jgi:integral membrane sensor domain MASE1